MSAAESTQQIDVGLILPSSHNREVGQNDKLQELTESVRAHGILQDLIVRPGWNGNQGKFELVAGERRWRAAKAAGLKTVPCKVRELSDVEAIEIQAIENLEREDLSPIEAKEAGAVTPAKKGKKLRATGQSNPPKKASLTAAGRKRLAKAMHARWAARKKKAKE